MDKFWRGPLRLLAIALATGVGLFIYGLTIPVYTDLDAARQLKGINSCDANGVVDGWYESMSALETMRHTFMQGGVSLILAGLTIFALFQIFGDISRQRLLTPKRRWPFFVIGSGVVGLSWLSQMYSLELDFSRGEFPWCADSIGIAISAITNFYIAFFFLCLVCGALVSIGFRELPVSLFQWQSDRPAKSWLVTIPFGLIAALVLYVGFDACVTSAFIGTPAAIFALYLIESTRSALLSFELVSPEEA